MSISRSDKRKYDFYQMKLETSVIPLFCVILSGKSISGIIFVISGDLHGRKVYFKVKYDFSHIC